MTNEERPYYVGLGARFQELGRCVAKILRKMTVFPRLLTIRGWVYAVAPAFSWPFSADTFGKYTLSTLSQRL